ncbi:P-loop containing nucleoside triphosphate hydrolase protein [Ephemerocybe angulata]|uniref:P-loop containing nucleoside triphosphate hydrolase protein n=1 Tax=Ephemerocybe angulata TaxID=980116 RepID=A0A8H6HBD9_9AGAR|nr:P-loop containing nucleoside triphosphate hydrolase protein [Tulosesus angulatus]
MLLHPITFLPTPRNFVYLPHSDYEVRPGFDARVSDPVLSYEHLSYSVPSASNGGSKLLIDDISLDGPSGAGKSTLLDLMAFRKEALPGGKATLNGKPLDARSVAKVSCFVEQEDALLRELSPLLGLQSCAEQKIGTPISRGISGGQKRRVTAACAMVTFPRILFLDEVTSGLDSTAAREVISSIRTLALAEGMIVVASIHQPSLDTLSQFTTVVFLAEGKLCYSGGVNELDAFFDAWKRPVGRFINPADHAMNFLNTDFNASDSEKSRSTAVEDFRGILPLLSHTKEWTTEFQSSRDSCGDLIFGCPGRNTRGGYERQSGTGGYARSAYLDLGGERSVKNYMRNLLAYGVRAGMYGGMGFMLATIWIRLGRKDSIINDRLSVHFYSVAFLAFVSTCTLTELANLILEERSVYYRESKNGLYSTLPFVLANTLVTIPFLFLCTVLFTVICYWAIGLNPGAAAFFRFLGFLFLAIFAAESQVVVVASLLPIFVAALAITAFLNGFWMSVGGYFIKARSLPRFWYYSFHFMDYQKYAFELLTNSDLRGVAFTCNTIVNGACACAYPSSTPSTCTVSGDDVLNYLDIDNISYGKWAAIVVCISIIYRIALYGALKLRSK